MKSFLLILGTVTTLRLALAANIGEDPGLNGKKYSEAAGVFADAVLQHGRDTYGTRHSPLFVDGLQVETLEPVRWKKKGQTWVLCNFASQQALLRTLDGLSALTKDPRYREAAEDATRYALQHLRSTNGLLYWGGHMAWDLAQDRAVGQYPDVHEMKDHEPYYGLFWRVDAAATRELLGAIWAAHVLDWSLLDYNRHARTERPGQPQWDHAFVENVEVPFPSVASNLSFAMVTPSLVDAGITLALLDRNTNALTWTRRLIYRWQQARDPKTGLSGGQLSYRQPDRAQEALGHVHPKINEAKIVASYHQVDRYHHLPLVQMQAAEQLIAAGGQCADVGRDFIRWASEDLKTYARYSFQPKTGLFISLMTDGTPIQWQQSRTNYYSPAAFAPIKADGCLFWSYAMAYRLTHDEAHWNMAQQLARQLGLGEIGPSKAGKRQLQVDTVATDWHLIYALLELEQATQDRGFFTLACRIADSLLKTQTPTGLFPRHGRLYARTGDEIPLALLHLAAALDGKESLLPPAIFDNAFFHCDYDGPESPRRPGTDDNRTYDTIVFYGPN